jgi:hypothetical protein
VGWRQGDQLSLLKNRPNCSPALFVKIITQLLPREKSTPKNWATSEFKKLPKGNTRPLCRRKFAQSGVDVMIPIFCDFSQFSAKNMAFLLNTNVMINFFSEFSFVLSQKRQFFLQNVSEKIFLKIITSVPGHTGWR